MEGVEEGRRLVSDERMEGVEEGEKLVSDEINQFQRMKMERVAQIVMQIIDYAISKFTKYFTEQGATLQEGFEFLEDMASKIDLIPFIDAEIARDAKMRAMVSIAGRLAGTFVRKSDGWVQILSDDEKFLELIMTARPDVYEHLKDKPLLVSVIRRYILYRLGL